MTKLLDIWAQCLVYNSLSAMDTHLSTSNIQTDDVPAVQYSQQYHYLYLTNRWGVRQL